MPNLAFPRPTPRPRKERSKIVVHGNRAVKIVRSITIAKTAREVYAFWRAPQNLREIVDYPVTITPKSETEWHWEIGDAAKPRGSWDSLIINDKPGSLLAWRSREGAKVPNAGTVRFKPVDGGTLVTVKLEYEPTGGRMFAWLARLSADSLGNQVTEFLTRLKAFIERPPVAKRPRETPVRERRVREK